MPKQHTVASEVSATGVALHSGVRVQITLKSAPPDSGIIFRRTDLNPPQDIPARANLVKETRLATTLVNGTAKVATVEHLLAACVGCGIDNAIIEANYRLIDYTMLDYEKLGIVRERTGNRLGDLAPRNSYQTADGGWVAISGGTQGIVERLFRCMGREDLVDDPRFANNAERIKNVVALDEAIAAWMIQHPMEHVLTVFEEQEVSGAPVNNVAQIADNEHFRARNLLLSIDDPELGLTSTVHVHPRMSATPGGVKYLGGTIGRDNEAFYLDQVGLSREEFDALRQAGAV